MIELLFWLVRFLQALVFHFNTQFYAVSRWKRIQTSLESAHFPKANTKQATVSRIQFIFVPLSEWKPVFFHLQPTTLYTSRPRLFIRARDPASSAIKTAPIVKNRKESPMHHPSPLAKPHCLNLYLYLIVVKPWDSRELKSRSFRGARALKSAKLAAKA